MFSRGVYSSVDDDILDLTKYASHVYVLVRREELRASKIMAKRLTGHSKVVSLYVTEHVGTYANVVP